MSTLKRFYQRYLKCSNKEKFDKDFHQILEVFYYFGFYQSTPSKKRVLYGIFMFIVLVLTCTFGPLNYVLKAYNTGDISSALTSGLCFSYMVSFATQIATFAFNQDSVIAMIKKFHLLHESEDEHVIQDYRKKCLFMMGCYQLLLKLAGSMWIIFKFFGLNPYNLFIPAIYDKLAYGYFYYFLFPLNLVHLACLIPLYTACDFLHIICIVRAEANLKILSEKLRSCTDDIDLKRNEKNLVACIRYHFAIIE